MQSTRHFFSSAFLIAAICFLPLQPASSQDASDTRLPHNDTILLTVFLKHDQTMNNKERRVLLDNAGFRDLFPPDGVEIVDHYVMMGIGQVIVLRLPPNQLRTVNRAIEHGAWGAFQTEFYITYDLREARIAEERNRDEQGNGDDG